MSDRITLDSEIFNKAMNVIARMPWADVNALMVEVQNDARPIVQPVDDDTDQAGEGEGDGEPVADKAQ